jgi:signal transduction histidine kinase
MTANTSAISQALEAYQRFDPPGWVDVYRLMPWWAGIVAMALGIVMMTFGNGKLFRLAAAPLGALVALLWAPLLAIRFGYAANARQITLFAAAALTGLGLLFPPGALFFICGAPGGLLGGELAGAQDWVLGFLPGFLVTGALGAAAHRHLGAVASSIGGAWLLVLGLLAAVAPMGSLAPSLAGQPLGCLMAAGLFAVAGTVFQLFVRLSPEERARLKDEKRRAKRKREEQKAVEERWSNYSKDKGLDT